MTELHHLLRAAVQGRTGWTKGFGPGSSRAVVDPWLLDALVRLAASGPEKDIRALLAALEQGEG